jgi:heme iron utilization protein
MAVESDVDRRPAAIGEAKRLLRLSRTAALATLGPDGAPLTTWVGCASDFDGSPLFLFSGLSQHTKNLAIDPRGSLLLIGRPGRGDPLNHPRVTLGGSILPHPDPYARKRYLQRNPKAKLYAPFADFAVYRLRIAAVHFNGGFGRAAALEPADILAPPGDAGALAAAEDDLLAEINASKVTLAARSGRAVGLDAEGLDLAAGGLAARIDFLSPAFDPPTWRARLAEALAAFP